MDVESAKLDFDILDNTRYFNLKTNFIHNDFILPLFTSNNLVRSDLFRAMHFSVKMQNFTLDVLIRTVSSKNYPRRCNSHKPGKNPSHLNKRRITDIHYDTVTLKVTLT